MALANQYDANDPNYDPNNPNSTLQIGQQLTPGPGSPDFQGQTQAPAAAGPVWDKNARNSVRDAWQSGSGSLQDFYNNSPWKSQLRIDGDKLYLNPTVDDKYGSMGQEVIDAVGDSGPGGRNTHEWTGIGPGSGGAANDVYTSGAPGLAGSAGSVAGGGVGGGVNGAQSSALFDLLMKRASQAETVDKNDPVIRAQSDAFNAQGQQARRDFLAAQAEKAGPYGNQTSEERRSAEELGKSTGSFEAQAMANELAAKRQEIESSLNGAAGFLTEQQRMSLQEELTKLQLSQQNSQFNAGLGQNAYQFDTSRYDNLFA